MRSITRRLAVTAVGVACFVAPTALVASAAHADTMTPSLIMNDNSGGVWSLRSTGASNGTQNFAGTIGVAFAGCTFDATATKTNIPGTGTWSWTFSGTLVSGPCVAWVRLTGTGIGTITGTFTNPFSSAPWSGTIVKGAGSPS